MRARRTENTIKQHKANCGTPRKAECPFSAGIPIVHHVYSVLLLTRSIEQQKLFYIIRTLTLFIHLVIVGTNTLYLSRAINHCTGHNFRTLLNNFRIDYATRLIRQNKMDGQRVRSLCRQCGFASNSVFHIAFKERMNVTPMQYIHNCMAQSVSDELSHILLPEEVSVSVAHIRDTSTSNKKIKHQNHSKITTNSNHYEEKVY